MPKVFRASFNNNTVQMSISGIQGSSCADVSAAFSKNLGATLKDVQYTDEFYLEPPVADQQQQSHGDALSQG